MTEKGVAINKNCNTETLCSLAEFARFFLFFYEAVSKDDMHERLKCRLCCDGGACIMHVILIQRTVHNILFDGWKANQFQSFFLFFFFFFFPFLLACFWLLLLLLLFFVGGLCVCCHCCCFGFVVVVCLFTCLLFVLLLLRECLTVCLDFVLLLWFPFCFPFVCLFSLVSL